MLLCLAVIIAAGAHQLWQAVGTVPRFFSSYLDPLLAVPVILSIIYVVFRFIPAFRGYRVVTWGKALFLALVLSVFFEVFAPRLKSGFYADAWDVVAYFAGAVLFVWIFGEDGRRKTDDGLTRVNHRTLMTLFKRIFAGSQ